MILENQRYGRNKDTLVNKSYIESGEYKRKFDNATDNPNVNKSLYICAKNALKHRSGTELEEEYLDENLSEYETQLKALQKLKENHEIDFSEVL